jgi:hypothetical protein
MTWHHNSVTALASAQEMCCMLEAYWMLSAKRFTDNVCMLVDREILGTNPLNPLSHHYHNYVHINSTQPESLISIFSQSFVL